MQSHSILHVSMNSNVVDKSQEHVLNPYLSLSIPLGCFYFGMFLFAKEASITYTVGGQ